MTTLTFQDKDGKSIDFEFDEKDRAWFFKLYQMPKDQKLKIVGCEGEGRAADYFKNELKKRKEQGPKYRPSVLGMIKALGLR